MDVDEIQTQVLQAISSLISQNAFTSAEKVRNLAEAWAWLERPDQGHGGCSCGGS